MSDDHRNGDTLINDNNSSSFPFSFTVGPRSFSNSLSSINGSDDTINGPKEQRIICDIITTPKNRRMIILMNVGLFLVVQMFYLHFSSFDRILKQQQHKQVLVHKAVSSDNQLLSPSPSEQGLIEESSLSLFSEEATNSSSHTHYQHNNNNNNNNDINNLKPRATARLEVNDNDNDNDNTTDKMEPTNKSSSNSTATTSFSSSFNESAALEPVIIDDTTESSVVREEDANANKSTLDDNNAVNDLASAEDTLIPFPQFITSVYSDDDDNNNINRTSSSTSKKPLFLIHPGPAKTATTTIQKGLWELRNELIKDNILYAGMYKIKYDPNEFNSIQDKPCQNTVKLPLSQNTTTAAKQRVKRRGSQVQPACWTNFVTKLQSLRDQNVNVVMSDERLGEKWGRYNGRPGRFHWKVLKQVLEEQGWDVHVLLTYRRQMDWLPSVKAQYDLMGGNRKWDGIPGVSNGVTIQPTWPFILKKFFNQDPDNKKDLPPELSYSFGNITDIPVHVSVGRYKTIEELYTSYHVDFELPKENIHIWNMAQKTNKLTGNSTDLISILACHIFPNATNACNAATKPILLKSLSKRRTNITAAATTQPNKEIRVNQARSYDYFRVVGHAARHLDWINVDKFNRQSVADQFESFYENVLGKSKADWPMICPSNNELEMYLQSSLMLEERLLPEFYNSNQGKVQHTEEFWKNANVKKKYCDIDPPTLLESSAETFKDFFQNKLVGKKL